MPTRRSIRSIRTLALLAGSLAAAPVGCVGAIDGYLIEPLEMGEQLHESRALAAPDAVVAPRTIGVINPFRLDGRSDFVCVGRDGQYIAARLDADLATHAVTIDLPPGLSDVTVRHQLAEWSDAEVAGALHSVVVPDLYVFGSVSESRYELVPLRGYESTITYELTVVDRAGQPVWTGRDRRRGFVFETPRDAADRLIASLVTDLGLERAPEVDR